MWCALRQAVAETLMRTEKTTLTELTRLVQRDQGAMTVSRAGKPRPKVTATHVSRDWSPTSRPRRPRLAWFGLPLSRPSPIRVEPRVDRFRRTRSCGVYTAGVFPLAPWVVSHHPRRRFRQ